MTVNEPKSRVKSRDEILDVALTLFANDGFQATSIQQVADQSGYSKSSVLYHFASKEAMLDAAIEPAIAVLGQLVDHFEQHQRGSQPSRIGEFVDFLLQYRREASILLIQGNSLVDIPVIRRSNELVQRLSNAICISAESVTEQLRVGVGLAGAAFVLAAGPMFTNPEFIHPDDEVRAALVEVLSDLFRTEN